MSGFEVLALSGMLSRIGPARFRLKQIGDEPSGWGSWLICPAEGYLELEWFGPVPIREVEWLQVEFARPPEDGSVSPPPT